MAKPIQESTGMTSLTEEAQMCGQMERSTSEIIKMVLCVGLARTHSHPGDLTLAT